MKMRSVNPFTEEVLREFDPLSEAQCEAAVAGAVAAFSSWRQRPVAERAACLPALAQVLRRHLEDYARLISLEMGKPIRQARAEVEKCAWLCDHFARTAADMLQNEPVSTEYAASYVRFDPLGVVLGIMPWNFPFWQVFRFAVPTLVAGNVCLLKPASNVPMAGLEMEQIFAAAGFPPQVVQSLLVDAAGAAKLIEDPRIAGVSLTGSVPAGRHVGALAGAHIKKVVLELGGSDPFLVLDDADPDQAARLAVQARFMNGGQSCIAAKRLIVHSAAARPFTEKFLEHFHALKVGDPLAEETDIGPLARREFLGELAGQLDDAVRRGAAVILGPAAPPGKGYFFRPAVVTGVTAGMRVLQEEVFGPLAPILVVADQAGAVAAANATVFGLGAAIMSRDTERAERLAAELETGFVAINDLVKSDPRLPFGGVKDSGVGRELSRYGLCEFVNIKSVVVQR